MVSGRLLAAQAGDSAGNPVMKVETVPVFSSCFAALLQLTKIGFVNHIDPKHMFINHFKKGFWLNFTIVFIC